MNSIEIQPAMVRDALRGLHDVERLAYHPFVRLEIVTAERKRLGFPDSQLGAGFALRRLLLEAIEHLEQPAASRYYTLLKLHFVDKQRVRELRSIVDLGDRSIYVEQNRAFKFLAQQLVQAEIEATINHRVQATPVETTPAPHSQTAAPEPNAASGTSIHTPFLAPAPADFPLVGRDELVSTLRDAVLMANGTAVVLYGLPGMGKTLLANHLAHDATVRQKFADGVLWAALGPSPNLPGVLDTWAAALHLNPIAPGGQNDLAQQTQQIRARIGTRRMLIVLDDATAYEHINLLKIGGPNCTYLVTTQIGSVAGEFQRVVAIGDLDDKSARELLAASVGNSAPLPFEIADRVLAHTGGMPLAIRLAGRWLKQAHGNPTRAAQLMDNIANAVRFAQLDLPRLAPNAHPSLPADATLSLSNTFDASLSRLSEAAQATLVTLAHLPALPHSISLDWIAAVVHSDQVFDDVMNCGLLTTMAGADGMGVQFGLHPTLANYLFAVTMPRMSKSVLEASIDRLFMHAEESVRQTVADDASFKAQAENVLSVARLLRLRSCWNSLAVLAEMACPIALRLGMAPEARELAQSLLQAAMVSGNAIQAQHAQTWIQLAQSMNGFAHPQAESQHALAA